jgi:phosphatidylserine/phosphatidylglycerophosphate/cardiolipin synthase-like enzyme
MLGGPWLPTSGTGEIRNPLDSQGPPLRIGALLRLPNFKANHRKVALTGDGAGSLVGIVASSNPHDASSAHSNVALRVEGEALRALLASELAVARLSGWRGTGFEAFEQAASNLRQEGTSEEAGHGGGAGGPAATSAAIATEGAIREQLLERLDATAPGDAIDVAQFYLSDRKVVVALRDAAKRGVAVRLLLDPNKDAFGFEKSGRPNREVAGELLASAGDSLQLRWYRTHGEQFHAKLAAVRRKDRLWFTVGSANFTRRNLGDYNLEANVAVETSADSTLAADLSRWYETLWTNPPETCECSADAGAWPPPGRLRYWLYRFMEGSGTSTF